MQKIPVGKNVNQDIHKNIRRVKQLSNKQIGINKMCADQQFEIKHLNKAVAYSSRTSGVREKVFQQKNQSWMYY